MRFIKIALVVASVVATTSAYAQSSGSSPQAGVAGPADAKGGTTKTMPRDSSAPASGSMGTSKGSSTGGNAGGTENRN